MLHDSPQETEPERPETLLTLGLRTGAVAAILGVPEHRLANLIRHRLITPPSLVAGRRVWRPADVEAARHALVARGAIPSSVADGRTWEPGPECSDSDPIDIAQDLAAEQDHEDARVGRRTSRAGTVRA